MSYLRQILESSLAFADPAEAVKRNIPEIAGRVVVLGGGKAAVAMARALDETFAGSVSGIVIAPRGSPGPPPDAIVVCEASHPLPDEAGRLGTERMLERARGLEADETPIVVISGGGSALMTAPRGISLEKKRIVTDHLLKAGASIAELNSVRKHLSRIKGGGLLSAIATSRSRASVHVLVVSDVVGDELSVIASGPTAPDPTTYRDALRICDKYSLADYDVRSALARGLRGETPETLKPGDPLCRRTLHRVILSNRTLVDAAAAQMGKVGPALTMPGLEGEARAVARSTIAELAALPPGSSIVSGGELTVTVEGAGRGGPNMEFLLALLLEAEERGIRVSAAAIDTDGSDGSTDAAGAMITPDVSIRASALGLDGRAMLAANDSYSFFDGLGLLVRTGFTGTNLNDLRIVTRVD